MPRLIIRSVLTLAILGGVGFGGYKVWKSVSPSLFGSKKTDRIPTVKSRTATISEEIVAVGRLRAVFSTELRSEINGRIAKISAVDGQRLKKGEEILRLDQQDILTQITEIERSIEAAKLRALKARRDNERLLDLNKRGVVTIKDMEDSRITFSLAENDSAIAEARAANLRDKLDKTIVRAPHDGTLLLRDLTEGQVITSAAAQNGGTMLGEVADLSLLMIRTNINEIDVARLKVGDTARVRVDSMRSVALTGSIKRISTSALETGADRTRVFPVDVVIDEADERLRPGMSATAIFTLARVEDTLAVPLNAVFATADGARYVFLAKGETFMAHAVEVGIADTRFIQILSGLNLGDDVARTRPLVFEGEIPVLTVPTVQTKPKKPGAKSQSLDPIAQLPGQPNNSGPKPKNNNPKPQRTP